MRKVHLSFLGLGTFDPKDKKYDYKPAVYRIEGQKPSGRTKYIQVAEAQIFQEYGFDLFIIVATQASHDLHGAELENDLKCFGVRKIEWVIIEETMTAEGQWKWFEEIGRRIEIGDELVVDLTHGFRSTPIVFSTAINLLQKSRRIILKSVLYGVFEKRDSNGIAPIIDMKDFYVVNEWAEAVSRLVEDADARKLASLAETLPEFQTGGLNDSELIAALNELTAAVRNVEINWVAKKAQRALSLIHKKRSQATETARILMDLVIDKFTTLAVDEPPVYNQEYYLLQLEIVRLLLEHKLFMQAYTVMRELIGSIGLLYVQRGNRLSAEGRKRRCRYADVFINMLQFDENKWSFKGEAEVIKKKLEDTYEIFKAKGVIEELRSFTKCLVDYRNGFDHAWTSKEEAFPDIEKKGEEMYQKLRKVIEMLSN